MKAISLLILLFASYTRAQACPQLQGLYQVPDDLATVEIQQTNCDAVIWKSRELKKFIIDGPNTRNERNQPIAGYRRVTADGDLSFFLGDKLVHVAIFAEGSYSPGNPSWDPTDKILGVLTGGSAEAIYLNAQGDLVRESLTSEPKVSITYTRLAK